MASAVSAGVLVWLASATGRVAPTASGSVPSTAARALPATGAVAAVLLLACVLVGLLGGFDGIRVPRELSVLDTPLWAAGLSEPVVPFDGAAIVTLLMRAALGVVVLEVVLRGVVLPSLARLIGPWPAIGATA